MECANESQQPPEPVFVFRGSSYPVMSISFLPAKDGEKEQFLAAGMEGGQVITYDLKSKSILTKWQAYKTSSILSIASTDSTSLWTQGRSSTVNLWDLGSGLPLEIYSIDLKEFLGFCRMDVIYSKNYQLIAAPGPCSSSVTIYEVRTTHKICTLLPPNAKDKGMIMSCKWITSGSLLYLLCVYENGGFLFWDWSNCKILSTAEIKDTPMCVEYNQNLKKGACCSSSEVIYPFNITPENDIQLMPSLKIRNPGISSCVSRPDERLFVTGGWDHRIRIFSWKKYKPLAVLDYHKKTVECVKFSQGPIEHLSSGPALAAASSDNTVSLWDIFN